MVSDLLNKIYCHQNNITIFKLRFEPDLEIYLFCLYRVNILLELLINRYFVIMLLRILYACV